MGEREREGDGQIFLEGPTIGAGEPSLPRRHASQGLRVWPKLGQMCLARCGSISANFASGSTEFGKVAPPSRAQGVCGTVTLLNEVRRSST